MNGTIQQQYKQKKKSLHANLTQRCGCIRHFELEDEIESIFLPDHIERGLTMKEDTEVCTICGNSVKFGSGNYVNRVLDINENSTKLEQKKPFPRGQFICAGCDEKDSARR